MKTIIVTGGIGSGKSTVSAFLRGLGLKVIEADRIGHEIIEPETPGWQEVVNAFGQDVLTPELTIDRQKLAQKVFHNAEALKKLNEILHPKVDAEINTRLQHFQDRGERVVAIEVALITPADWIQKSDYIWVVKAPKEVILKRLCDRGMSQSESLARMSFQPPVEEKLKRKLTFIENDGTPADLQAKVEKLWREIHNK
jgi:dephospho-CoA kinase